MSVIMREVLETLKKNRDGRDRQPGLRGCEVRQDSLAKASCPAVRAPVAEATRRSARRCADDRSQMVGGCRPTVRATAAAVQRRVRSAGRAALVVSRVSRCVLRAELALIFGLAGVGGVGPSSKVGSCGWLTTGRSRRWLWSWARCASARAWAAAPESEEVVEAWPHPLTHPSTSTLLWWAGATGRAGTAHQRSISTGPRSNSAEPLGLGRSSSRSSSRSSPRRACHGGAGSMAGCV